MENGEKNSSRTCCGNTIWIPWSGLFVLLFVLMRMTIGWHFLFEGIAKIYSTYTPKPFSSAGYFRESPGPIKSWMAGILPADPDKELLKSLEPVGIQDSFRQIGDDFVARLKLDRADQAVVLDLVEKYFKQALVWRDGGAPAVRLAFEKALTDWERGGTDDLKKKALQSRLKVIALLKDFQEKQGELAKQIGAITGSVEAPQIQKPDPAKLDRLPLEMTEPSQVASARAAILGGADKILLPPAMGKNDPISIEQWKKWDKVVGLADKWADATQDWLTSGEENLEEPSPDGKGSGTLKKVMATPDRVVRFSQLVANKDEALSSDRNWLFRKDVDKGSVASTKAAAASARASLKSELDKFKNDLGAALDKQFTEKIATVEASKPAREIKPIELMDWMTIWGITAIGAGLFTGTLTRMAALAGAAFLAMTYLAVPAFPWLPAPPQNEGNYVFVNKNVVEMMALLVIAAAPSGRWFGGDAFLGWLLGMKTNPNTQGK